jgi:1,4-alpha-glucan branching enzyme
MTAAAIDSRLDEADLRAFAAGEHLRPWTFLGAHRFGDDVRFAVWAPAARSVAVVGDFNDWDLERAPMQRRDPGGVWEAIVAGVPEGALYKFALVGPDGEALPWKADPYAFAAQLRPETASLVAPLPPARALPPERAAANRRDAPISIYEVHLGSWKRTDDGGFLDWEALAASLPAYAADLGFTHVELLPISEHPFDGSWGYQTIGLHAPSARFGAPSGLARFVAACHARGLGVLLDWVPAHFPADAHGLARFDGTALYEYADPREGLHRDWDTLIPDFGKPQVRAFLTGSALYWLERFGVDGLRVDAVASMLYRDYSRPDGEWVANVHGGRENLEAIALLQALNVAVGCDCPGAVTIAEESTAFPGVSAPVHAGGLGFHYKWNMGWMNDTLAYVHEDPVHRRWHHARMTFGLVYAFSENFVLPLSHDEVVHGKGSLLGKLPGDDWQRLATLRAYYGFQWGHPGKKLLFMGQEFAQPNEWNHDAALPWHLLGESARAGVAALVRDLNALYRARPALHALDFDPAGFAWLVADDADQSVLTWLRFDGAGDVALVACNFTPVPRRVYRVGVPVEGRWKVALDTDAVHYGGTGQIAAIEFATDPIPLHGHPHSLALDLPPLATVFMVPA